MLRKVGLIAIVGVAVLATSAMGAEVKSVGYSWYGENIPRCEMDFHTQIINNTNETLTFKMNNLSSDSKFTLKQSVKPHSSSFFTLSWNTLASNKNNKNMGTLLINGNPSLNKTNNFSFKQYGSFDHASISFYDNETLNYANYKATVTDRTNMLEITVNPLLK